MLLKKDINVRNLILLLFVTFSLSNITFAQRRGSNAPFIYLFGGDLSIQAENILDYYDSKNDLTFGLGFGVPLSKSFSFDVSASYFEKESKYQSLINLNSEETALLKQIILNAGFQLHILPNRIVGLSFLAGVNYSFVDEERTTDDGVFVYEIEESGNLGIYGGANIELSLGYSPVALFADARYTYSWKPILVYDDTYSELRYTAGLKIYLSNRWKKIYR